MDYKKTTTEGEVTTVTNYTLLEPDEPIVILAGSSYDFSYMLRDPGDTLPMLEQFGPDRDLVFALGDYELKATINASGDLEFRNIDWDNFTSWDYLTLKLYQNGDDENILWEYALRSVKIEAVSPITPGTEQHAGAPDKPCATNTSDITVTVYPADMFETLTLRAELHPEDGIGSGGHTHESEDAMRPDPMLLNPGLTNAKTTENQYWAKENQYTVSNGKIKTKFKPSMGGPDKNSRGIAGKYRIVALWQEEEVASADIEVKYDLGNLPTNSFYFLKTCDGEHGGGDYHYGKTETNAAIIGAAMAF